MRAPVSAMAVAIKTIRVRKGFTQARFAENLNVRRNTVARWESGLVYPSTASLFRLSKIAEGKTENSPIREALTRLGVMIHFPSISQVEGGSQQIQVGGISPASSSMGSVSSAVNPDTISKSPKSSDIGEPAGVGYISDPSPRNNDFTVPCATQESMSGDENCVG